MFYDPAKTRYFKEVLQHVTGQAMDAAGYRLEDDDLSQKRGLVRFLKPFPPLGENAHLWISWQLLAFEQSPLARFKIDLARRKTDGHDTKQTLSSIIWNIYDVHILPDEDFWWTFRDGDELPHAVAHAGKLLFGYGVPWLEMRDDAPTSSPSSPE